MASGAGASAGAGAARIDKWDQDIERSIPIFSPGDLRKQFIGAFDRVVGADDVRATDTVLGYHATIHGSRCACWLYVRRARAR